MLNPLVYLFCVGCMRTINPPPKKIVILPKLEILLVRVVLSIALNRMSVRPGADAHHINDLMDLIMKATFLFSSTQ